MTINQFFYSGTKVLIFQKGIIKIPHTWAAFEPSGDVENKGNKIVIGNWTR